MKVSELIEALQKLPQDHEVILSKDGEGNHFSPLAKLGGAHYAAQTTWYGELADPEYGNPDNAVVLWPVS